MNQPIDYIEYIHSELWRSRASEMIRKAGYRCQQCGSIGRLQVHHNAYNRLGAELDSDLLVVCEKCHKNLHNLKGG